MKHPAPTPAAPARPRYITAAGERRLREELTQLWKIERPQVTAAVHEAAKNGDRSENGDYIYGKRRLREIDRRVRYLSRRLEQVRVVRAPPTDRGRVYFGAWVTLEDEDGETSRYRIVGADEFDATQGLISMDSPLARALLGKRLDDEVRVNTPGGERVVCVIAIDYETPRPD
ncbi:MAG: Transcription elongation factor GreB [Pseudomonadales bacterium]|nr:Transcription elongation factor GreB [Pseudomonadales bacterium]